MTITFELIKTTSPYHLNSLAQHDLQTISIHEAIQDHLNWELEHQHLQIWENCFLPVDVMPTKILKKQWILPILLLCKVASSRNITTRIATTHQKNTHTVYPQATTLLERSMFFVERLLEIHTWSSNSQKFEVCWLAKNGCCLRSIGATNTTWSAINAIWFFLDTWIKFSC